MPSGQLLGARLRGLRPAQFITRVYLALPISATPRIEKLIKELRDTTASVYFVPNIFAFDLVQARCVEINGMPVLSICDSPLQGMSGIWKRAFDVLLASVVLLLCWPVLLAIALAIRRFILRDRCCSSSAATA